MRVTDRSHAPAEEPGVCHHGRGGNPDERNAHGKARKAFVGNKANQERHTNEKHGVKRGVASLEVSPRARQSEYGEKLDQRAPRRSAQPQRRSRGGRQRCRWREQDSSVLRLRSDKLKKLESRVRGNDDLRKFRWDIGSPGTMRRRGWDSSSASIRCSGR